MDEGRQTSARDHRIDPRLSAPEDHRGFKTIVHASPRTEYLVAAAVQWAERIMRKN